VVDCLESPAEDVCEFPSQECVQSQFVSSRRSETMKSVTLFSLLFVFLIVITAVSGKGGRGGGRGRGGGGGEGLLGLVNANREMIFVFLGIFGGLGVLFCLCYCKYCK